MEKEICIKFAEFIVKKRFNKYTQKSYCNKHTMWFTDKKGRGVTTEELYKSFELEYLQNKQ
jgi:hypothetical protein